jgi:predicted DNA-binding transcriptional regulator YafY
MAKTEKQKLKLLYLKDYLCQKTDENHPASAPDLLEFLQSKGISAERKSLYDDIAALNDYGIEILYRRGKPQGYYATHRDFALPELKLLVDAVLSSRFLSQKQSAELIRKLAALSKSHEALLLRREIVLSGRVKAAEDNSFSNVDVLHEAIEANCQIRFRYFDWGVDLQKHYRQGVYTASPYALLWDDENYYLIAHSERHGLTHYRVDKMEEIFLTNLPRIMTEDAKYCHSGLYSKEQFGMYRGERVRVKLRFASSLAGVVIDRFGRDLILVPDGKDHFTFQTHVALSPNFMGWLTSFGGRATITHPPKAVEAYKQFCQTALDAINEL